MITWTVFGCVIKASPHTYSITQNNSRMENLDNTQVSYCQGHHTNVTSPEQYAKVTYGTLEVPASSGCEKHNLPCTNLSMLCMCALCVCVLMGNIFSLGWIWGYGTAAAAPLSSGCWIQYDIFSSNEPILATEKSIVLWWILSPFMQL